MEKSKSVLKNIRKSVRRRKVNALKKRKLKDAIKKFKKINTKKPAVKQYPKVQAVIDKSIQDGLIKKNTAARYKSRLARLVNRQK